MSISTSPTGMPPATGMQVRPEESSALRKVIWFSILQLAGAVAGFAVGFYVFVSIFSSLSSLSLQPNATPAQVGAALGPLFQGISTIIFVTAVIQLASVGVLTLAFRELGKVDRDKFSIPSTLTIVQMVSIVLLSAAGISLVSSIPNIIAQAPTTSGGLPPAFAALLGSLFVDFALLAVGVVVLLVGVIGGQILGLWRVGSRYNETVIKVGAIFTIIPLLNIVAPILVLIGAYQVKGRLPAAR